MPERCGGCPQARRACGKTRSGGPEFDGYYTVRSYSFLRPGRSPLTRLGSFGCGLAGMLWPTSSARRAAAVPNTRAAIRAPRGRPDHTLTNRGSTLPRSTSALLVGEADEMTDTSKSCSIKVIFSGFSRPRDSSDEFHKKSHLVSVPLLYISQPFISRASISKRLPRDGNMSDGGQSSNPARTLWGYLCAYWWWRTIPFKPRK